MNKERLKNYCKLKKEIELLNQKLKESPRVMDKVKGSTKEFPYTETSFKIEGIDQSNCYRITTRIHKANKEKKAIEEWIDSIEDPEIRIIMEMRYLWGRDWLAISTSLGGESEGYARKKHDRFFNLSDLSDNNVVIL